MRLSLSNVVTKIHRDRSYVKVFCRNVEKIGKRITLDVYGFRPFLYVKDSSNPRKVLDKKYTDSKTGSPLADRVTKIEKDKNVKKSIFGEGVTKIYTKTSGDVPKIRDQVFGRENTFQADVLFNTNFLVGSQIYGLFELDIFKTYEYVEFALDWLEVKENQVLKINFDAEFDSSKGFSDISKISFTLKRIMETKDGKFEKIRKAFKKVIAGYTKLSVIGLESLTPINDEIALLTDIPLRTLYVDIEVIADRMLKPDEPYGPISHITYFDSYSRKMKSICFSKDIKKSEKFEIEHTLKFTKEKIQWTLQIVENELELLNIFRKDYIKIRPDLLTAWNASYDYGYLIERMNRLEKLAHDAHKPKQGISPNFLSPLGQVKYTAGKYDRAEAAGVIIFDLLDGYKMMTLSKGMKPSYRLDDVGLDELKVKKIKYSGKIGDMLKNDIKKSLKYNARDVELIVELDMKLNIIRYFDIRRKQVGCLFEDCMSNSKIIDVDFMRTAMFEELFALPTGPSFVAQHQSVKGAHVFAPKVGLYDKMFLADLKSWYPSIMQTLNMSPETKLPKDYVGDCITAANGVKFRKDKDGFIKKRLSFFNRRRDFFKRCMLCCDIIEEVLEKREGIIKVSIILKDDLFRKEIKEIVKKKKLETEFKFVLNSVSSKSDLKTATVSSYISKLGSEKGTLNMIQNNEKFKINSIYGVMLFPRFRLYDPDIGDAVTATGRAGIQYTADYVESDEFIGLLKDKFKIDIKPDVIYGDTDSIYIYGWYVIKDVKTLKKVAEFVGKKLSETYPRWVKNTFNSEDCQMSIRVEKITKKFGIAEKKGGGGGKKRYFYWLWFELVGESEWKEENKMKVVGFEARRSNVPKVGQLVQKKVMEMICNEKSKAYIRAYLIKVKEAFKKKEVTLEKLAFRVSIKAIGSYKAVQAGHKPPIHVRAAMYSNKNLGVNWQSGDKVKYVYVSGHPRSKPATDVVSFEREDQIKGYEVNYMKHFELSVENILEPITKILGYSFGDFMSGTVVTKLI